MSSLAKGSKFVAFAGLLIVLAAAMVFAAVKLTDHQTRRAVAGVCPAGGGDHVVTVQNNTVVPDHVAAPRCDRLTIVNKDDVTRLMAFGPHDRHTAYDGVTERLLMKGQSLTVTLDQTGNFRFHDHLDDAVQGTFTVN